MKKPWFCNYFNLAYVWGDNNDGFTNEYKRLKQRTAEEVEGIIKMINLRRGLILDAPCGYGRHSIAFASRGFNVIGIDINKFFLRIARYRSKRGLDVYENRISPNLAGKVKFKAIDLRGRGIPDEFFEKFDCVINMFFSFGYFNSKDNIVVLKKFYKTLKLQGHLIIHAVVSEETLKNTPYLSEVERRIFPTKILGKEYPKTVLFYRKWYNPKTKIFNSIWQIGYNHKLVPSRSIKSRVKIYSIDDYKKILKKVGFQNIKFYKDWKGNKFRKGAEELIIHARK